MSELLSQQEIDALLKGNNNVIFDQAPLSSEEIDALGEIGNISMGTAATTLFTLLRKKVTITTPRVTVTTMSELAQDNPFPFVAVEVFFTDGLEGANLLIMKEEDVKIITDLLMGGEGTNIDSDLNDMHLSAIGEVMNQMIGSSATSLATIFSKSINISPPRPFIINFNEMNANQYFNDEEDIVKVCFKMEVDSLINSEMMQLLPLSFAKKLVENLLNNVPEEPEKIPLAFGQTASNPLFNMGEQKGVKDDLQTQRYDGYSTHNTAAPKVQRETQQRRTVDVQPVVFQSFDDEPHVVEKDNKIDMLMDVPLQVSVELGKTHKLIKEILELNTGSIIELDKLAGEPIDVIANGKLIAKGEVVVIDENFAVRITEIMNTTRGFAKL